MHLRPPSIDRGVVAFLWAFGFFLFLWFGMWAVDVGRGTAFVLAALAGCAIFLYIRVFGQPGRA
jgi:hypothetical protein